MGALGKLREKKCVIYGVKCEGETQMGTPGRRVGSAEEGSVPERGVLDNI